MGRGLITKLPELDHGAEKITLMRTLVKLI